MDEDQSCDGVVAKAVEGECWGIQGRYLCCHEGLEPDASQWIDRQKCLEWYEDATGSWGDHEDDGMHLADEWALWKARQMASIVVFLVIFIGGEVIAAFFIETQVTQKKPGPEAFGADQAPQVHQAFRYGLRSCCNAAELLLVRLVLLRPAFRGCHRWCRHRCLLDDHRAALGADGQRRVLPCLSSGTSCRWRR